jgi:hypothetical protein
VRLIWLKQFLFTKKEVNLDAKRRDKGNSPGGRNYDGREPGKLLGVTTTGRSTKAIGLWGKATKLLFPVQTQIGPFGGFTRKGIRSELCFLKIALNDGEGGEIEGSEILKRRRVTTRGIP